MHIVYVSREYPPSRRGGGIASYVRIMAEAFAARGHRVTVIAASDDTRTHSVETANGVEVHRLDGGDFLIADAEPSAQIWEKFRFLYRFKSYRRKIVDEIRKLPKVDIIEVAEFGAEGLYLDELTVPVVYRLHTPDLLDHNNFKLKKLSLSNFPYYLNGLKELKLLRRNAQHITSCSTSLKEWAIKYLNIPENRIQVIYNPIQPGFASLADGKTVVDKHMVFFAGTICDWKGACDLIDSCKIINRDSEKVKLVMAGKTGQYAERLKEGNKDADWLDIIGKVPQVELKKLYRQAGVVCFPSWWENMPMVCIEAMACGAIVIGSNSGGMAEIIEDGKSGFLLPPQNPQLWAEKISETLDLPDSARAKISDEATRRINNVFSLETILNETEDYFNTILN